MTRREFIAGVSAAAVVSGTYASPVKSLVAEKGLQVQGGWNNPYVTDGLIAMWDGEWNAGWGIHDPNATRWVDLVGNRELSFADCLFDDNVFFLRGNGIVASHHVLTSVDSPRTIEFCWGDTKDATWMPFIGFISFGVNTKNRSRYETNFVDGNGVFFDLTIGDTFSMTTSGACTISSTSVFKNAVLIPNPPTWSGTRSLSNTFVIRSKGATYTYTKIRFIRLYSRALSAAEIAHNYAVDKARFNLP